jgi:hypothetical protein
MARHLSTQEMERIEEFARTPAYKRSPEMLLPEETHQE